MAYDVIKTIRGREYRYRVQSERDPASGKTRNRWTYVGRVASERSAPPVRAKPSEGRARLLAALERILERGDAAAVTADAIAREAGVAHGTFYRYFADRTTALRALAEHMRAIRGLAEERLRADVVSAAQARVDLRAWIERRLSDAVERRTSLRAWYALMASDPKLAAFRAGRRAEVMQLLAEYFSALTLRGFASVVDSAATASALYAMIDGFSRATILEGEPLLPAQIAAAADIAERAVFAPLSP